MAIDKYSNGAGDSEKQEEEYARKKRLAEERAAKIRKIQGEIRSLELTRAEYAKLLSDVSSLSEKLGVLSNNLSNSANSISKGLVLEGIPIGEASMQTTSKKASDYANNLNSTQTPINNKIRELDRQIEERRTRLRSLAY